MINMESLMTMAITTMMTISTISTISTMMTILKMMTILNSIKMVIKNKKAKELKYVRNVVALKHLVALCASSPRASEGNQMTCLRNCIDCTCRVVLQGECACVLSDYTLIIYQRQ